MIIPPMMIYLPVSLESWSFFVVRLAPGRRGVSEIGITGKLRNRKCCSLPVDWTMKAKMSPSTKSLVRNFFRIGEYFSPSVSRII